MIEHWVEIELNKSVNFRKKVENMTYEEWEKAKQELADALRESVLSTIEKLTPEEFVKRFCKFSRYWENTGEGIIVSEKVYY